MKTIFYKIIYKNEEVVYVGVTTRTINERFREHLISKSLNHTEFSIIEFECIEHPEINSLEVFYEERQKVVELEQKYIREELNKGSNLLNISSGGEWGSQILNKLMEESFFKEFGTYEGYKEYKVRVNRVKRVINHWIGHRSENKVKRVISHWISVKSENKVKRVIGSWTTVRSKNKVKTVISSWVSIKSKNRVKKVISNWINHRKGKKFKYEKFSK